MRAYTLAEVLVALLSCSLLFGLVWSVWYSARSGEDRVSAAFSVQQDLALAMNRLVAELREGKKVFYPKADGQAYSGLAFVTADGRPVAYMLETEASGKESSPSLYRVDMLSKRRKLLAGGVKYFKVSVAPPAEGKKPCLVTVNLAVRRRRRDGAEDKGGEINIVRKIFLRNLKEDLPE